MNQYISGVPTARALPPILAIAAVLMISGCGAPGGSAGNEDGDVGIAGPSSMLELSEVFRVGNSEPFFGRVFDVEIGPDGTVYIADGGPAPQAYRYDAAGVLLGELGKVGEGPGEYGRPQAIMATADSIVVLDGYYNRILVFEPDGRPRRKTDRISSVSRENPTTTHVTDMFGGAYVGFEYPVTLPGMPADVRPDYAVRRVESDGTPGDTLSTVAPTEVLIVTDERSMRSMIAPFGRSTMCAFDADRAYCAWSATIAFDVFAADGSALPSLNLEYDPVPILESEKADTRSKINEVFLPLLTFPENRPALGGLAVADDGRLWAKVTVDRDDAVSHFWIIDPKAKTVAETVVEENVSIRSIRGDRACGVVTTTDSAQLVACYRIGF